MGINYFYQGGPKWPTEIPEDDEGGCHGCFWYNPEKGRESSNRFIDQN